MYRRVLYLQRSSSFFMISCFFMIGLFHGCFKQLFLPLFPTLMIEVIYMTHFRCTSPSFRDLIIKRYDMENTVLVFGNFLTVN